MGDYKKRSISRDLTIGLVLTIAIVSIVIFSLDYHQTVQRERSWLKAKADEYIDIMSTTLEIPLWNMDRETITYICTSYLNNDLINQVHLLGNSGESLFLQNKKRDIPVELLIFRSKDIYHQGELIGRLEIQFTREYFRKMHQKALVSSFIAVLGPVLVLIVATGLMLRAFLKKPLQHLKGIAESYVSGDFHPGGEWSSYREFDPFVSVLVEMVDQIDSQMNDLRRAEEQYRHIFENVLDGIYQSTPEGQLRVVNPAMARIFGYDSPEIMVASIKDAGKQIYVHPEQRDELINIMRRQNYVAGVETEIYRADGSIAVISLNAWTVRNAEGEILYLEGTVEDITQRKQSEDDLHRYREQLEELIAERTRDLKARNEELQREILERKKAEEDKGRLEAQLRHSHKMEAIGTLASGIAHDFNNILQAAAGYIQLIAIMENLDPRIRNYAREIDLMLNRATDLVERLLTFSRKVEPDLSPVDLKEAVIQAVSILERTIPKMIAIETHFCSDDTLINADLTQINQMLMNLGTNARDAMPGGGRLLFEISREVLDRNDIQNKTGLTPGDYILLQISDTGQGIGKEDLNHIFDPFYTTKDIGKGTGLGLSMVYGIVKSHGGFIECLSRPDRGTTFKVYLPAYNEKTTGVLTEIEMEEAIQGGNETVLLVDDEEAILEIGREMLEQHGYVVITADSGERALELYQKENITIDLVILDLGMPGMGGHKALIEILKIDPTQKVIISSGYGADEQARAALASGAQKFIAKPYRLTNMLKIVRIVLDNPI